jgi:hypothetical protein
MRVHRDGRHDRLKKMGSVVAHGGAGVLAHVGRPGLDWIYELSKKLHRSASSRALSCSPIRMIPLQRGQGWPCNAGLLGEGSRGLCVGVSN